MDDGSFLNQASFFSAVIDFEGVGKNLMTLTLPETNIDIAHENPIFPGFHTIKMVDLPWLC